MRSSRPPQIGGPAASIATCSDAGDSWHNAESTESASCVEKRRVSSGARAEASNTTPVQKHDVSSSRGSRSGDSSPSDGRVARHRSQHAFLDSVFAEARLAAASTAQVYGQSSTAAMATKIGSERMGSAAVRDHDTLINSTLFWSKVQPERDSELIPSTNFHSLNNWSPANINPVCRNGYVAGLIPAGDPADDDGLLLLHAQERSGVHGQHLALFVHEFH